jgi:hypothetical protein
MLHVVQCQASILQDRGPNGETLPAVGIWVDDEENIDSVERQIPSILGGFPTQLWSVNSKGGSGKIKYYPPKKIQ